MLSNVDPLYKKPAEFAELLVAKDSRLFNLA
jgi:hypothetical protein